MPLVVVLVLLAACAALLLAVMAQDLRAELRARFPVLEDSRTSQESIRGLVPIGTPEAVGDE